jgi:penicillin-binding protein 1C
VEHENTRRVHAEHSAGKDQILEAYLNLVPFRGELVGIDALSRTLFGKAANGLEMRGAGLRQASTAAPSGSRD